MDALSTSMTVAELKLASLEKLLAEAQGDYRAAQQDYQDLQLEVARFTDTVKVVETAQLPEVPVRFPYVATAILMVDPAAQRGEAGNPALTYGQMVESRPVLEAVIAQLNLSRSPEALAKSVWVEPVPDTQLFRLNVENTDAPRARLLADTIAQAFIDHVQALQAEPYVERFAELQGQIETLSSRIEEARARIETSTTGKIQAEAELARLAAPLADDREDYRARQQDYERMRLSAAQAADAVLVVEPAQSPLNSSRSNLLYISLATASGLIIGICLAFLLESISDTLNSAEEISQRLNLSTLGSIGHFGASQAPLAVVSQPRSPAAEAFRVLAANLRFSSLDRPLKTLLVTSPASIEGKSIVAANLAAAVARSGQQVILVDADLRRPRQKEIFDLEGREGLVGALLQDSADGQLQTTGLDNMRVLTSGDSPPNPAELLASPRLRQLLEEQARLVDLVVIDSPPLLAVADASILASLVDGVLLVVRAGRTRAPVARQAVESLRQAHANLIGAVLNAAPGRAGGYYYYHYRAESHGNGRVHGDRSDWKRPLDKLGHRFRK
jgi:non-specific protein-tyrosine kinase